MSRGERKTMIRREHPELSLSHQCRLLSISRSSFYYAPRRESSETLALMRRIDELFLKYPFYGSRQVVRHLRRDGIPVGRHRVRRLMRLMGLQAIYQAPRTSTPHPEHRIYPYLLKGLAITRSNHVWCADITRRNREGTLFHRCDNTPVQPGGESDDKILRGLGCIERRDAICIRDSTGRACFAQKVASDPDEIAEALSAVGDGLRCAVLETGRMTNWLFHELGRRRVPVVCVDARQAHAVLSQMHNKTDENDAAMLAELARTGFYKSVTVKSRQAQEKRALLRAREVAVKTRMTLENTIRGLLASFGLRLPSEPRSFAGRVLVAIESDDAVAAIIRPLVHVRTDVMRGLSELDRALRQFARNDETCRRLMSIPGVGAVSAFAFTATIDDPSRFHSSRSVGAYLGLTSKRYQSGERDIGGRITKRGDRMMRTILYEAANSLLTRVRSGPGQALQKWARAIKARSSHKKAVVALARKLAVLMHRLWRDGTLFEPATP